MKLEGRVALVTGAARRVGRAIALGLSGAGCDVAIHHHRSSEEARLLCADVVAKGRRAITLQADLSTPSSWPWVIEQTVGGLGRLDVLINNASIFITDGSDTIETFDPGQWDRIMALNVRAPTALVHHAIPHLQAHGSGCVVNICDIAAESPWPAHLAYSVSKSALVASTQCLAKALAPTIRVNAVSPGIAVFPDSYSERKRQRLVAKVPLARAGTPEEIAQAVGFLVQAGDYMTGQVIVVDGGRGLA